MRARARIAAAVLLFGAAGVWLGILRPAARTRDLSRSEYARAREERERLRVQITLAEKRASAGRTPEAGAAAARALRASLLRATQGLPVGAVQIAASVEHAPVAARGRLGAEGSLADVLRLADRLARPDSGFLIERVGLGAAAGQERRAVRVDVEGVSLRAGS